MKKGLIALAAALAVAVGIVAVIGAGAQEGAEERSFIGRVAEKLGVTEDQLTTAVKDSQTDIVNEKLAAGEITQEQADRAKERIANSEVHIGKRGGRHHGGRGGHWCFAGAKLVEETATILNVEPAVVADGLQQGKSLAEVAAEHGKSADEYKAALGADVKAKLDEKVASGDISQERADRKLAKFSKFVDRVINFKPDPEKVARCREKLTGQGDDDADASPKPDTTIGDGSASPTPQATDDGDDASPTPEATNSDGGASPTPDDEDSASPTPGTSGT
jgi:hypothetical protein